MKSLFLFFIYFFKGMFPHGCSGFKSISLNVEQDESNLKEDSGMHDIQYSQVC